MALRGPELSPSTNNGANVNAKSRRRISGRSFTSMSHISKCSASNKEQDQQTPSASGRSVDVVKLCTYARFYETTTRMKSDLLGESVERVL